MANLQNITERKPNIITWAGTKINKTPKLARWEFRPQKQTLAPNMELTELQMKVFWEVTYCIDLLSCLVLIGSWWRPGIFTLHRTIPDNQRRSTFHHLHMAIEMRQRLSCDATNERLWRRKRSIGELVRGEGPSKGLEYWYRDINLILRSDIEKSHTYFEPCDFSFRALRRSLNHQVTWLSSRKPVSGEIKSSGKSHCQCYVTKGLQITGGVSIFVRNKLFFFSKFWTHPVFARRAVIHFIFESERIQTNRFVVRMTVRYKIRMNESIGGCHSVSGVKGQQLT